MNIRRVNDQPVPLSFDVLLGGLHCHIQPVKLQLSCHVLLTFEDHQRYLPIKCHGDHAVMNPLSYISKSNEAFLVSKVLNCQFVVFQENVSGRRFEFTHRALYLEAVVTNNTAEGDDGVRYSQEVERRLHVSAALLQYKKNCFVIVLFGVQLTTVSGCDPSSLDF